MSSKLATATRATAAKAGPNFQVGGKQVFLPNHVITMLPPRRLFSPYFATFQVPLRFNKLDLRDYLYHAYGVEVRAVRSWLTPQRPQRRYGERIDEISEARGLKPGERNTTSKDQVAARTGPWYRPQPIKRMMVELVKPFVFPPVPAAEAADADANANAADRADADNHPRAPWDYDLHRRTATMQAASDAARRRMTHDKEFRLRIDEDYVPAFRVGLARQARELVRGDRVWRNDVPLDERWHAAAASENKAVLDTQDSGRRRPNKE